MSFVSTLIAFFSMITLGAPPAPCPEGAARAPTTVVDTSCEPTATKPRAEALKDDMARYAAMEAKNGKVDEFRGGAVAVYLSTGAAIVIVVVLLIILL